MTRRIQAGARAMAAARGLRRSPCPVANTLDLVGDRWSLLVIRDLLGAARTFGELLASPEGIPTNILADRLKRLEESGIVDSALYQEHPARYAYSLSAKGRALRSVVNVMVKWGKKHLAGTRTLQEMGLGPPLGPDRQRRASRPARKRPTG